MEHSLIVIETPFGKNKIEVKPWISGGESEYINQPLLDAVSITPSTEMKGVDFNNIDMGKITTPTNHRLIEKFVVSVDGKKEKVLDLVLALHEDDTEFLYKEIAKIRTEGKKK